MQFLFLHFAILIKASQILLDFYTLENEQDWLQTCFGFQKLRFLRLSSLGGLNRLIIDKGALPFLEKFRIGPSPHLKELPIGIHHLQSLKTLDFLDMLREFVLRMQPAEGFDFWKVKHVPFVRFWYRIQGENYKTFKPGDPKLLELFQR